ncbi:MAG: c-type cytochrome [Gammaproteobacteria bacterium]
MTNKKHFTALALLAGLWTLPSLAADRKAGEEKSALCTPCHGPGGKSSGAQWPNLAAQQQTYIINQLEAFKSGSRKNPMMESMAANLSREDMANLAAYFSGQPAAKAGGDPDLAKTGREKAGICLGCHGPDGAGNGQFPRLAGQHPDYLLNQLQHFKSGERKSGQMQAIAGNLSPDDMKALAAYFGSL